MNVARLSFLSTVRLYPSVKIPDTNFCQRLSRPQGHSAAGRVKSMKTSKALSGIEQATFRLLAQCFRPPRCFSHDSPVRCNVHIIENVSTALAQSLFRVIQLFRCTTKNLTQEKYWDFYLAQRRRLETCCCVLWHHILKQLVDIFVSKAKAASIYRVKYWGKFTKTITQHKRHKPGGHKNVCFSMK